MLFFSRRKTFIIFLSNTGFSVIKQDGKRISQIIDFDGYSDKHKKTLQETLSSDKNRKIALVVDLDDQIFIPRAIPYFSILSFGKLLDYAVDKEVRKSAIKGAAKYPKALSFLFSNKKDKLRKSKKRNYLIYGTDKSSQQVDAIISVLNEGKNSIIGAYSLPLEYKIIANIIINIVAANQPKSAESRKEKKEKKKKDKLGELGLIKKNHDLKIDILVIKSKVSGFRQIALFEKYLILNRFLNYSSSEADLVMLSKDIQETCIYISKEYGEPNIVFSIYFTVEKHDATILKEIAENFQALPIGKIEKISFVTDDEILQNPKLNNVKLTNSSLDIIGASKIVSTRKHFLKMFPAPYQLDRKLQKIRNLLITIFGIFFVTTIFSVNSNLFLLLDAKYRKADVEKSVERLNNSVRKFSNTSDIKSLVHKIAIFKLLHYSTNNFSTPFPFLTYLDNLKKNKYVSSINTYRWNCENECLAGRSNLQQASFAIILSNPSGYYEDLQKIYYDIKQNIEERFVGVDINLNPLPTGRDVYTQKIFSFTLNVNIGKI